MPDENEFSKPYGLPMAYTFWPTANWSESPIIAGDNVKSGVSNCKSPTSADLSLNSTFAIRIRPSVVFTLISVLPAMTWAAVRIRPSWEIRTPEPKPPPCLTPISEITSDRVKIVTTLADTFLNSPTVASSLVDK